MDRGNIGKEEVRHCGTTSAERQISGWLIAYLPFFIYNRKDGGGIMTIAAAFIMPHPPVIIPEIGKGQEKEIQRTIDAFREAAREIAEMKPELYLEELFGVLGV